MDVAIALALAVVLAVGLKLYERHQIIKLEKFAFTKGGKDRAWML
jgi:hypothetical protein